MHLYKNTLKLRMYNSAEEKKKEKKVKNVIENTSQSHS